VLGRNNARLVAPKLGNVLFRGIAKFFAGFAKGVAPFELCGGTENAWRRASSMRKEKEAQSRTGTSAGRNGCRLKRRQAHHEGKEEYGGEPDSLIHCGDGGTRSKPEADGTSRRELSLRKRRADPPEKCSGTMSQA